VIASDVGTCEMKCCLFAAKGKAEAEQLTMKGEAYKFYKDAAVVDMLLEVLPKVTILVHNSKYLY